MRTVHQTATIAQRARDNQQKVVLVTGVFDGLHTEHITFLRQAKKEGDVLLVGVESDARVKQLKGPDRPVHSQEERALAIERLGVAEAVFVLPEQFSKSTEHKALIDELQPHILAISSHSPHQLEKEKIMRQIHGEVKIVHAHNPNISTTKLLAQQQGDTQKIS